MGYTTYLFAVPASLRNDTFLTCFCVPSTTDRRERKEKERGLFEGETSLVDGTTESGNFHVKVKQEQYEQAVTMGAFDVLTKRINKISSALDSILEY